MSRKPPSQPPKPFKPNRTGKTVLHTSEKPRLRDHVERGRRWADKLIRLISK